MTETEFGASGNQPLAPGEAKSWLRSVMRAWDLDADLRNRRKRRAYLVDAALHAYDSMTVAMTMAEIAEAATKHLGTVLGKGKLSVTREQARGVLRQYGTPKPERWRPEEVVWLIVPPSWRWPGSVVEHEDDEIRIMREEVGWRSPAERAAARAASSAGGRRRPDVDRGKVWWAREKARRRREVEAAVRAAHRRAIDEQRRREGEADPLAESESEGGEAAE